MTSLTVCIRALPCRMLTHRAVRTFSVTAPRMGSGDTGAIRRGGEAHGDTWTRREKAAEDMYIYEREKTIMQLLREKIAAQETLLAQDRAMLAAMEDQYGHVTEERTAL